MFIFSLVAGVFVCVVCNVARRENRLYNIGRRPVHRLLRSVRLEHVIQKSSQNQVA